MIDNIEELKRDFLEYYKELPNQRLAANKIGRDEDTIVVWKKKDPIFAKAILVAKADWAIKNVKGVKSKEWLLERLMKDHFAPRQELTGKEGKDLPTPIFGGLATKDDIQDNDSNK